MHPFGKWVYDNLKYRKIAMIGYDFAFGWEVAAGFHRTFEEAGGQVVQKLWPPLNTPDFAPYVAQLRRDVDAVWCVFSGADALRFSKQYAEAGLRERLPLIGNGTFTDEHVLRDRKSTRLNSSHITISYAVFCLKKKNHYEVKLRCNLFHVTVHTSRS